jgi:hypothetical protein
MKNNHNQREGSYHSPAPKRVAPRMNGAQKNRGTKNVKKGR